MCLIYLKFWDICCDHYRDCDKSQYSAPWSVHSFFHICLGKMRLLSFEFSFTECSTVHHSQPQTCWAEVIWGKWNLILSKKLTSAI